jgi:polysaccharide biosynthesis protein PslG
MESCVRMLRAVLATVTVLLALFCPAVVRAQSRFYVGISVHLAAQTAMLPGQLSLIVQAGASSIRDDVGWDHIELEKDRLVMPAGFDDLVNQALKANVQPLLILDYGNRFYDSGDKPASPQALTAFARYAAFVVQHFKGRVHMYEMWNEWNNTTGNTHPGTPQDYVRLLRVVYPAVKAIDPSAVFIAGAIAGRDLNWLSAMLSAGALGSFDALSIHPYNFDQPVRTSDAWAQDMLATEDMIHRYTGGRDLPLYITEMGWPTYSGANGISPQEAATNLAQMFLLARTMKFLNGIWWYDFRDDGWDASNKENDFGLVRPDLTPKAAFAALKTVAPVVRDASRVEYLSTGGPSLHALRFRLRGDMQVLALWNVNRAGPIRVRVTGSTALKIRSTQPDDNDADAMGSGVKERAIEVSHIPVLITGANLAIRGID